MSEELESEVDNLRANIDDLESDLDFANATIDKRNERIDELVEELSTERAKNEELRDALKTIKDIAQDAI